MRVGVTGSRTWGDPETIRKSLGEAQGGHRGAQMLLMHGQCPPRRRGARWPMSWVRACCLPWTEQLELLSADWLADRIARELGWQVEMYRANWGPLGKGAGFARNAEMVARGADQWRAFVEACSKRECRGSFPHGSHGAMHCVGLARQAGIPAIMHPAGW